MQFTPRRLRCKYLNRDAGFVVGLALVILGTTLAVIGAIRTTTEMRYINDGVVTEARVQTKWQAAIDRPEPVLAAVLAHGGGQRKPRFQVSYEYQDAAGQPHHGSVAVSKADWDRLQAGDALEVEYLANSPDTSRLFDPDRADVWLFGGLLSVGGLLVPGAFLLIRWRWRMVADRVRLIATGQPVLGLIDEVRPAGKKGKQGVVVRYRYLVPRGAYSPQLRTATTDMAAADQQRWRVGGPILVVLDPANPERHAADLFNARPDDLERLCQAGAAV